MLESITSKILRKRRASFVGLVFVLFLALQLFPVFNSDLSNEYPSEVLSTADTELAKEVLQTLEVKGRAPKTGYSRSEFGDGWANIDGCDVRNLILQRDLTALIIDEDDCTVLSGSLIGPYSNLQIEFVRGRDTSSNVQIDHVVSLSDAWQKGAQLLTFDEKVKFANDPLNLLAVDGKANIQKGDSDAASWLPKNKSYRCRYVARQIAVKQKYNLWITEAEKAAMNRILNGCPSQQLPVVGEE